MFWRNAGALFRVVGWGKEEEITAHSGGPCGGVSPGDDGLPHQLKKRNHRWRDVQSTLGRSTVRIHTILPSSTLIFSEQKMKFAVLGSLAAVAATVVAANDYPEDHQEQIIPEWVFFTFSNFFQIVWNKTNFWLIQLEMKILSPAALSPIAQYLCPSWPCWPWWTFSTPSRYVEFDTLFLSHCIQCFRK